MKTKNKMLAALEIAVVLCSLFLVALPAIVADQNTANEVTTASEDDFILGIYGNANEDDTIDMRDYTHTARIICWLEEETDLADANYDGRISVADMTQIGLIILGRESELTFIDSADRIETVKKPIERIVATYIGELEMLRTLEVPADHVVGVSSGTQSHYSLFFPEYQDTPTVGGGWSTPDLEAVLELDPDVIFLSPAPHKNPIESADFFKSAGVTPLLFWCSVPDTNVPEEMRKLGYIFGKEKEAEEYRDWYEGILNSIKEKVEKIPEEDKPKVYFEMAVVPYMTGEEYITNIEFGGGKTIFPEVTEYAEIDREAVVERDPEIIVKTHSTYSEDTDADIGFGYGLEVGDIAGLKVVRDEIMSRPELQLVKAVEDGEVYVISAHIVSYDSWSGGRAFLHKVYMAKWLQPELFEDLDPKAIHQEYLTDFQGLDIDLDEKGVFVYHPEKNPYGY